MLAETRRPENSDTRTDEVQTAKASHQLEEDPDGAGQFESARLGPLEKLPDFRSRVGFAPAGDHRL
jgi:hypothetical protein